MRGALRISLVVAVAALAACVGELVPTEPIGGGDGPDAGTGGGGDPAAREFFDGQVEPLLLINRPAGSCATCHQGTDAINGPDFLGPALSSHFDALSNNPRLVSGDPTTSLLVTKGAHTGDAFAPLEISTINQWILMM